MNRILDQPKSKALSACFETSHQDPPHLHGPHAAPRDIHTLNNMNWIMPCHPSPPPMRHPSTPSLSLPTRPRPSTPTSRVKQSPLSLNSQNQTFIRILHLQRRTKFNATSTMNPLNLCRIQTPQTPLHSPRFNSKPTPNRPQDCAPHLQSPADSIRVLKNHRRSGSA